MNDEINKLENKINYHFKDEALLYKALLHRSAANEKKIDRINSNERLEFLGDAVLELSSSNYLLQKFENLPEGELTRKRASMVCEPALAYCAKKLGLDEFIILGKGEEKTGGRRRPSITSDAMEAVIGAIYLDGGYEKANDFILDFILNEQDEITLFLDSKTILQEKAQENGEANVEYKIVKECGPDHDKQYEAECIVNSKVMCRGIGHTKKAAEQEAAYNSLKNFFDF